MVLSIQAKRQGDRWEAYCDQGREHTGMDAVEWARRGQALGAGEILVTSVDREGTREGFDIELLRAITRTATIPVIASGGMGRVDHLVEAVSQGGVQAVALAHVLHYRVLDVAEIRTHARSRHVPMRAA